MLPLETIHPGQVSTYSVICLFHHILGMGCFSRFSIDSSALPACLLTALLSPSTRYGLVIFVFFWVGSLVAFSICAGDKWTWLVHLWVVFRWWEFVVFAYRSTIHTLSVVSMIYPWHFWIGNVSRRSNLILSLPSTTEDYSYSSNSSCIDSAHLESFPVAFSDVSLLHRRVQ